MTFATIILAAAKSVGVPGALLLAICTHESNLNNILILHDGGSPSVGLCMVKESTAKGLGFKGVAAGPLKYSDKFPGAMEPLGEPQGLMIPSVNAKYAAKYLKYQLDRYDGDLCKSVAAYNSGTYHPSTKVPGKPRNLKYVKKVILHLDEEHKNFLVCGPQKVETDERPIN